MAVAEDNKPMVETLIKTGKLNLNYKDDLGRTALHYAASNGNEEMIALLVSCGLSINSQNNAFETPLMKACQFMGFRAIMFLLSLPGISTEPRDIVAFGWEKNNRSALDIFKVNTLSEEDQAEKQVDIQKVLKQFEEKDGHKYGKILNELDES